MRKGLAKRIPSQLPKKSQKSNQRIDLALAYATLIQAYVRTHAAKGQQPAPAK